MPGDGDFDKAVGHNSRGDIFVDTHRFVGARHETLNVVSDINVLTRLEPYI
jgi:hypothetical protein